MRHMVQNQTLIEIQFLPKLTHLAQNSKIQIRWDTWRKIRY